MQNTSLTPDKGLNIVIYLNANCYLFGGLNFWHNFGVGDNLVGTAVRAIGVL